MPAPRRKLVCRAPGRRPSNPKFLAARQPSLPCALPSHAASCRRCARRSSGVSGPTVKGERAAGGAEGSPSHSPHRRPLSRAAPFFGQRFFAPGLAPRRKTKSATASGGRARARLSRTGPRTARARRPVARRPRTLCLAPVLSARARRHAHREGRRGYFARLRCAALLASRPDPCLSLARPRCCAARGVLCACAPHSAHSAATRRGRRTRPALARRRRPSLALPLSWRTASPPPNGAAWLVRGKPPSGGEQIALTGHTPSQQRHARTQPGKESGSGEKRAREMEVIRE